MICCPLPLVNTILSLPVGTVPNVVYTCGAMIHNDQLVNPYAVSDTLTTSENESIIGVINKRYYDRLVKSGNGVRIFNWLRMACWE